MIKLSKEDKLMVLSLVLILSFVLIFLSFEVLEKFKILNNTEITLETQKKPIEELYNSIITVPKNTESSNIRKCLDDIFELINSKDYEILYNNLSNDFKNRYFLTLENFKNYMSEQFPATYSHSFSNYQKFNENIYVINVSYLEGEIKTSDLTTQDFNAKSDIFTLYIENENNYKFSFLSYIGSSSSEIKKGNDKITVSLEKVHLYDHQTIFKLKIINNTENDIIIGENKIKCTVGVKGVYYPTTVYIPANSEKSLDFTIYTGLSVKLALPTHIFFNEIIVGNTVYSVALPIKYPIDI